LAPGPEHQQQQQQQQRLTQEETLSNCLSLRRLTLSSKVMHYGMHQLGRSKSACATHIELAD
jgi:hypothetical protein